MAHTEDLGKLKLPTVQNQALYLDIKNSMLGSAHRHFKKHGPEMPQGCSVVKLKTASMT